MKREFICPLDIGFLASEPKLLKQTSMGREWDRQMKELRIAGKDFRFTGEYRIKPDTFFPSEVGGERTKIPTEMIFENDEGVRIGVSPNNSNLHERT